MKRGVVAEAAIAGVRRARGAPVRGYWLKWVLFYLLVPVFLAVEQGASESGSFTFVAKRYYILYGLVATLPTWWAMDIMSRAAHWLLRPWRAPLWLSLVLGAILALNLQATWTPLRQSFFAPYLAEGSSFYSVFPWRYNDPDYLTEAVLAWFVGGGLWLAVNLFFIRILDFPRLGYRAEAQTGVSEEQGSPGAPGQTAAGPSGKSEAGVSPAADLLFDKLPEGLGREVIALKAEEHYTRVYTDRGEALVLMRFRDAVELLGGLGGVQVHRSYWVNPRHVADVAQEGRSSRALLTTGLSVPISRSYRLSAMQVLKA